MSKGTLGQVVKRAISDAAFRRQLQTDPEGALKGFDLTAKNLNRPVESYLLAAVVYFVICFSLSMLVKSLQKKIAIIR